MDGKFNFSYQDGDVWFEWSPDSRWLLSSYIGYGGWNSSDIALVSASGNGEIHNLTNSGYNDGNGKWVLGGKAMIYQSDRAGYRSHGSWGAEYDEYIMFFDLDAYEKFRMTKEENAVAEDEKKADEKDKKDKDKKEEKKDDKKKKDEVKPLKFDFDNCKDRIVRLTVNSSRLGDAMLSPQGDTLYYQSAFEGDYDLWKHDMRENKTEIVMKGIGGGNLLADKDFKNLFVCGPKGIKKVAVADGKTTDVDFEANFNYRPYQEREYMFNHIWQQVKDKFYDPNIHGVNWKGYHDIYAKFLPYINNNYDYRDMLSEMLGELNASHTGARYRAPGARLKTASLGIFIDNSYTGNGIKIDEVVKRGPFTVRNTGVKRGDVIEKIDGVEIKADSDYNYLLDGKAGKPVRLTIFSAQTKKRNDVIVKPVSMSDMDDLLYKRWVERNRALVDSLSGGRLAYVHVKEMDSESFRDVYSELLNDKNRRKEAVIVDERHNGGGWLHDDLCTLLSGKRYQDFVPHGKYIGSDPFNKWTKPSCVMICENDYSNGHGFPWVYKTLGIGKLIGAPVAGTMTAVWWETLLDNTMVFGIPQVGCRGMDGKFGENNELYPDIEVYNTPEDYLNGNDNQLKAAVKEMLKEADAVNNK
jgi:C-terminal processing protease CtpA/Prc